MSNFTSIRSEWISFKSNYQDAPKAYCAQEFLSAIEM